MTPLTGFISSTVMPVLDLFLPSKVAGINGACKVPSCWNPSRKGHKLTILGAFFSVFFSATPTYSQEATVDLSTTIIGNREQPKVLYIVPWKAVNDSELEEQTIQSQLDIVFGHVERIELQRELQFIELVEKSADQEEN